MKALSLTEAAARMNWSRRTLRRALDRAHISPIGSGRIARITEADLAKLIEAMRCDRHTPCDSQAADAAIRSSSSEAGHRTGANLKRQRAAQTKRLLSGLRPTSTPGYVPNVLPMRSR